MNTEAPVIFEKRGSFGIATLNREQALNSLNLEMVELLKERLSAWESDANVAAVFLKGLGSRSFCSGGDVKTVVLEARQGNPNYGDSFFTTEYAVDQMIHGYRKPVIAFAHGIVMGGGIGLSIGARYRVATETTVFAMPEISIGLFPDVGGSYFLNRLPDGVGLFLALTAARVNASDALKLGLATHFAFNEDLSLILEKLAGGEPIEKTLHDLHSKRSGSLPPATLTAETLELIQKTCASGKPPAAIFSDLASLASHSNSWLAKAAQTFSKGSPTSAYLTHEQLRRGKPLPLKDCFAMELKMAKACVRGHDFSEGVRAVLIDKDQSPKWNPSRLDAVDKSLIQKHFA